MDYGMVTVSRTTNRLGIDYYHVQYEGGPYCQVSAPLVHSGNFRYVQLRGNKLYFGPFVLDVVDVEFAGGKPFIYTTFLSNNLHNKIVPHLFPLYVIWVEFWGWVFKSER